MVAVCCGHAIQTKREKADGCSRYEKGELFLLCSRTVSSCLPRHCDHVEHKYNHEMVCRIVVAVRGFILSGLLYFGSTYKYSYMRLRDALLVLAS